MINSGLYGMWFDGFAGSGVFFSFWTCFCVSEVLFCQNYFWVGTDLSVVAWYELKDEDEMLLWCFSLHRLKNCWLESSQNWKLGDAFHLFKTPIERLQSSPGPERKPNSPGAAGFGSLAASWKIAMIYAQCLGMFGNVFDGELRLRST